MSARILLAGVLLAACDRGRAEYATHPVVAATVAHFAPNVELGGGIERMSVYSRGRRFVPFVGAIAQASHPRFTQVRFFPDAEVRAQGEIDWTAPLRALELVSADPASRELTMSEIAIAFGNNPVEGCLAPADTTRPMRSVQYWVAPDSAGGLAVISDFIQQPAAIVNPSRWSVFAWSGAFRGSDTFLSPFDASACSAASRARARPAYSDVAAIGALDTPRR